MSSCGLYIDFDEDCSLLGRLFIRNPYNYSMDCASFRTGLTDFGPTRTQQSFKEESDINTILERFGVTGQMPVGVRVPEYGDFDMVSDYHSAVNAVLAAEESFMQMPAKIRDRFANDPGAFIEYFADPANHKEAIELGLLVVDESRLPKGPGGEAKPKEGA